MIFVASSVACDEILKHNKQNIFQISIKLGVVSNNVILYGREQFYNSNKLSIIPPLPRTKQKRSPKRHSLTANENLYNKLGG